MPVQPLPPVQIPSLGAGAIGTTPNYQDGATTSLGFSLNVPPVQAANLLLLNEILAQFVTPNDLPNLVLVKTAVITVSSAQLQSLFTQPVLLLAGIPGTFLDMISCTMEYIAGPTAYTVGASDKMTVQLGTSYSSPIDDPFDNLYAAGFLDQTTSQVCGFINATGIDVIPSAAVNGQSVYLVYGGGASGPVGGNGSLKLTISFNQFAL
jgi:hypothetical protein